MKVENILLLWFRLLLCAVQIEMYNTGDAADVKFAKSDDNNYSSKLEGNNNVSLNESLHRTEKFCWQLFYPVWKSKSFR